MNWIAITLIVCNVVALVCSLAIVIICYLLRKKFDALLRETEQPRKPLKWL